MSEKKSNLQNFDFLLIFLPPLIVLIIMIAFLLATGTDSHDTNEKLKKENYELKTKIRQLEDEKLKCLLSK